MSIAHGVLRLAPAPLRSVLLRYAEATKFLIVGGTCFVVTLAIDYPLKLTVLSKKPVMALIIATVLATVVSYILNREWSFRTRGGRGRHHEVILFFVVSGIGIIVNAAPLYLSRYAFDLRVPQVSRPAQEIADFVSGMFLGTLLAMVFRLWAFKKFVFPQVGARTPVVAGGSVMLKRQRSSRPTRRAGMADRTRAVGVVPGRATAPGGGRTAGGRFGTTPVALARRGAVRSGKGR